MVETRQPTLEIQQLIAERAELLERWDTKYAAAASFLIEQLHASAPDLRRGKLLEMKEAVKVSANTYPERIAGSYEVYEFQSDVLREIILRLIASIKKSNSEIDIEKLKERYQILDTDLSQAQTIEFDEALLSALNNGREHREKSQYEQMIKKIIDFIVDLDVSVKEHRICVEKAIARPRQGGLRGDLGEKFDIRIKQDVILDLLSRSPTKSPDAQKQPNWIETLKNRYLPDLNRIKTRLYQINTEIYKNKKN